MKYNRSVKCYYEKWIMPSKLKQLYGFMAEYHNIVTMNISDYEIDILGGKRKFDLVKMSNKTQSWFTARAKQVVMAETYDLISGTNKSCKALKQPYVTPKHNENRFVLSEQIVKINCNPNLKDFDLLVELNCFDSRKRGVKIAIPLKKNRVFNKWNNLGKLAKSIILTDKYIQFSFECEKSKRKEGDILGIDPGAVNLLTDSNGKHYGNANKNLLTKLKRKGRKSKAWNKCKKEIKYYINKTCKELPFKQLQLICLEDNSNIKRNSKVKGRLTKNMRSFLDGWTSGVLDKRVEMLCEENGVSLRRVAPFNNSRTCPVCGCIKKENRCSQDVFRCQSCGHTDNADKVGALNTLGRFSLGKYGSEFKGKFFEKHPDYFCSLDKFQ